jgi:WD40 repeat protein
MSNMPPENSSVPVPARAAGISLLKRVRRLPPVEWLVSYLFGDDVFISYSRRDGIRYAEQLAHRLSDAGYSVRMDLWETEPGKQTPEKVMRALRRSRTLVVVATPGALQSPNVSEELAFYKKTHLDKMNIIPMHFDTEVPGASWLDQVEGLPWLSDTGEALAGSAPSAPAVKRIGAALRFTRRNRRLLWASGISLATVLLLLALGVGAGVYAGVKVKDAQEALSAATRARAEAGQAQAQATTAKQEAEAQRRAAADAKNDADKQRLEAEHQAKEADKQSKLAASANKQRQAAERAKQDAQRATEAARRLEAEAKRNAADQRAIAHSRRLAGLSGWNQTPPFDLSLLLSAESFDAHRDPPTAEAEASLLSALLTFPALDFILRFPDEARVSQLVVTPDNRMLVTGSDDGRVIFWDIAARKAAAPPFNIAPGDGASPRLALTPDGSKLVAVGYGAIHLWDMTNPSRLAGGVPRPKTGSTYHALAAHSDNRTVATNGKRGEVVFWDIGDIAHPRRLNALSYGGDEDEKYIRLTFSPDRKTLVIGGAKGNVWLCDVTDLKHPGACKVERPHRGQVSRPVFSPDSRWLASTDAASNLILWDAHDFSHKALNKLGEGWDENGDPLDEQSHTRAVKFLTFTPDGRRLIYADEKDEIKMYDVQALWDGKEPLGETVSAPKKGVAGLTLTRDSQYLIAGYGDGTAAFWQLSPAPRFAKAELGGHGNASLRLTAFSSDGRLLASASDVEHKRGDEYDYAGSVMIIDLTNGTRPLPPTVAHDSSPRGLAFSPDGRTLASTDKQGKVLLWEADKGWRPEPVPVDDVPPPDWDKSALGESIGHTQFVAFADGGRSLVTFGRREQLVVWDLTQRPMRGRPLPLKDQEEMVASVEGMALSRDGSTLALGYDTGAVYLLNLREEGTSLRRLPPAHGEAPVERLAFSSDGRWLATGNWAGVVVLWELKGDGPKQAATIYTDKKPSTSPAPNKRGNSNTIKALAFGHDPGTGSETLAISAWSDPVALWDVPTHSLIGVLPTDALKWSMSFSPDGKTLAGGEEKVVRLFDVNFASWAGLARRLANREFDAEERQRFAPPADFEESPPRQSKPPSRLAGTR